MDINIDDIPTEAQAAPSAPAAAPAPITPDTSAAAPTPETPTAPVADATPPVTPDATVDVAPDAPTGTDAKPAVPPVTEPVAPVTDARDAAIAAAAKALGITETDTAKIPAAIEARQAELAEQQRVATEAAQATVAETAKAAITKTVSDGIYAIIDPIASKQALAQLAFEGVDVNQPQWWTDEVTGADALVRYNQLTAQFRSDEAAKPEWEARFQADLAAATREYETVQAKASEIPTKYPDAPRELVDQLTKFNYPVNVREDIARITDAAFKARYSTLNSENAALKAQVSGHAAAVEAARVEGRNAALAVLEAGKANPVQTGPGLPTREDAPGLKVSGGWSDNIPTAL